MVVLTGRVSATSYVYAENVRSGEIRGQRTDDGAYRIGIAAEVGDWMLVYYRYAGEFSGAVEFEIPEPEPVR